MYQALYRKYRPKVFDDVLGQNHITETLKNQVISGRLSHAYLFTGTHGTGKTTCAKILSRAVNCQDPQNGNPCNRCPACLGIESGSIVDVMEIDAASNNGVDNIRALRDDSIYSPASVKKRVYIVDEVHMLSTAAFNALLKIMEEPPEHLMFILATTELNKVPATILSRCQRFSFKRITPEDIAQRLQYVARQENIGLEPGAASLLARLSDGAMRDALSLMDQCVVSGGSLTAEDIYNTLGLAGNIKTAAIMEAIGRGSSPRALEIFNQLYASGKDISALFSELSSLCRDLLMLKAVGSSAALIGGYDDDTMARLSGLFTFEGLMHTMEVLQSTQSTLSGSTNRRADAELCLLHLCDPSLSGDISALTARIAALEAKLQDIQAHGVAIAPQAQAQPVHQAQETPEYDDLDAPPPWEDEDIPPEPGETGYQPQPEPQEEPKAVPSSPQGPKSGIQSVDFWPQLVAAIRSKLDIMTGMYLANAELCSAQIIGGELIVAASNQFILDVIGKKETGDLIAEEATTPLGSRPVVKFLLASALAPKNDKLKDLVNRAKGYDNIKIN